LDIDFQNNHKPIFYIHAEQNKPIYAYVSKSINTDDAHFPTPDTLSTEVKVLINDISENLYPIQYDSVDQEERIFSLFAPKPNYKSKTIANSGVKYVFQLKNENYPAIELTAYIPEPIPIDTFVITPNIAYSHGDYYMQHNLNIRFTPPEAIGHFCVNVYIDYTDTTGYNEGRSIRDGFGMRKFFKDNEVIKSDEYYSLNSTILSERHSGDFIPTIYLIHISDDCYNYVMQETAFIEYRENSEFFGHMPSHIPYSMVPNAYANVFAYSVTKKTGELIQLSEPTIND